MSRKSSVHRKGTPFVTAAVTFCGRGESDQSAVEVGSLREPISYERLQQMGGTFHDLGMPEDRPAAILHLPGFFDNDAMLRDLDSVPEDRVDKLMWSYQTCKNKNARWNTNFSDRSVRGDLGNEVPSKRFSSEVPFEEYPAMRAARKKVGELVGEGGLLCEINYYWADGGIGLHGDVERNLVVGGNIGTEPRTIVWQKFHRFKPVGETLSIVLQPGDCYIMSEHASGQDWKRSSIVTVRHAAGSEQYLKRIYRDVAKKRETVGETDGETVGKKRPAPETELAPAKKQCLASRLAAVETLYGLCTSGLILNRVEILEQSIFGSSLHGPIKDRLENIELNCGLAPAEPEPEPEPEPAEPAEPTEPELGLGDVVQIGGVDVKVVYVHKDFYWGSSKNGMVKFRSGVAQQPGLHEGCRVFNEALGWGQWRGGSVHWGDRVREVDVFWGENRWEASIRAGEDELQAGFEVVGGTVAAFEHGMYVVVADRDIYCRLELRKEGWTPVDVVDASSEVVVGIDNAKYCSDWVFDVIEGIAEWDEILGGYLGGSLRIKRSVYSGIEELLAAQSIRLISTSLGRYSVVAQSHQTTCYVYHPFLGAEIESIVDYDEESGGNFTLVGWHKPHQLNLEALSAFNVLEIEGYVLEIEGEGSEEDPHPEKHFLVVPNNISIK